MRKKIKPYNCGEASIDEQKFQNREKFKINQKHYYVQNLVALFFCFNKHYCSKTRF